MEIILNTCSAFLTSIISAVFGMAGGITLLGVMLMTTPLTVVVPIHGTVQLVSNLSRVILFIKHVDWKVMGGFLAGLLPFAFFGALLIERANPVILSILIGVFVLFMVHFPLKSLKIAMPSKAAFPLAGALAGFFGMLAGAVGPLVAPFFLNRNMSKDAVIASQALCQALTHLIKIILYGLMLGFSFEDYWLMLLTMSTAAILGTWVGKEKVAHLVSEATFFKIFRLILTLIALKILLWDGIYTLIRTPH